MPQPRLRRHDRPYYLIPIMMGMAGVLFSTQLEDPIWQALVVLFCLSIPLFVGGNILGRIHSRGAQRYLLLAAMGMLTLGAVVTIAGFSKSLIDAEGVPDNITEMSRYIGIGSLLLGLLVTLYTFIRSEAVIDELGDRFRIVADHISEGMVLMDAKGIIVLVNQAMLNMTELRQEAFLGYTGRDVAKRYKAESFIRESETPIAGVSEYRVTWEQKGKERIAQITESPVIDRKNKRVGTLLAVRDITHEHRLAEKLEQYTQGLQRLVEERTERLQESESRLRELLLGMQEGFMTIDGDGNVEFVNGVLCQMLRLDEDQVLGRPVTELAAPEERSRLATLLQRTAQHERRTRGEELQFQRVDGAPLSVLVSAALVRAESGQPVEYSLVVADVQELRDARNELESRATELEKLNDELREIDKAKDLLLSNVSHELRTPLATIDGYIDMFRDGELGEISDTQRDTLSVMSRNAQRLLTLINEMIEFSRMEIRGVRLRLSLFSPSVLLREAASSARPTATSKNLEFAVQTDADVPFIWSDRSKLGQVIGILVSNAVKFSKEGGRIELSVERRGVTGVAISVRDEGIGIDPRNQARVFNKFYQVDSSMTRRYEGTGIGLSIAKSIVDAHGGRIELESTPGKGSTFTVVLPEALFSHHLLYQPRTPNEGASISIVHLTAESRVALALVLEGLGYSVREFESGYEALRVARESEHPPIMFIVDETVGDLAGADFIERLHGDMATDQIPALLLKSCTQERNEVESQLYERGAVLEKPFTPEALMTWVSDVSGGIRAVAGGKES